MFRITEHATNWAKGRVRAAFVSPTGEERPIFDRHNLITFTGADLMARVLGGQSEYAPGYMGFIYGGTFANPAGLNDLSSRIQTWSAIGAELAQVDVVGNVLVAPISYAPSISVDGDAEAYAGNMVSFVTHSGNVLEYGFPTSPPDSPYSDALADGDYFYHAMLLSRVIVNNVVQYYPFARVTLELGAGFPQKPAGWNLALFWDITYS